MKRNMCASDVAINYLAVPIVGLASFSVINGTYFRDSTLFEGAFTGVYFGLFAAYWVAVNRFISLSKHLLTISSNVISSYSAFCGILINVHALYLSNSQQV